MTGVSETNARRLLGVALVLAAYAALRLLATVVIVTNGPAMPSELRWQQLAVSAPTAIFPAFLAACLFSWVGGDRMSWPGALAIATLGTAVAFMVVGNALAPSAFQGGYGVARAVNVLGDTALAVGGIVILLVARRDDAEPIVAEAALDISGGDS